MIAPPGSLKKNHDMSGAVMDHYGLFPRSVLELFNQLSGKGDIITLSICQMGGWGYFPVDLITDTMVFFDDKDMKYVGLHEVILNEPGDVIKVMLMLESKRYADKTKSNSTSSRTNA